MTRRYSMKISKINHIRTAVGLPGNVYTELGSEERGMIYYDPKKTVDGCTKQKDNGLLNGCIIDLDEHVKNHYMDTTDLYSVLNLNAKIFSDDNQLVVYDVMKYFSWCFSKRKERKFGSRNFTIGIFAANNKSYNLKSREKIIKNFYYSGINFIQKNVNKNGKYSIDFSKQNPQELAQMIVDKALKKTLRRTIKWPLDDPNGRTYDLSKIAVKLLKYISIQNSKPEIKIDNWNKGKGPVTDDELLAFVGYIALDREGKTYTATHEDGKGISKTRALKISDSIRKQNVKVQVVAGNDGRNRLMLSNSEHPLKRFAADFIKRYANMNLEQQNKELLKIKELMIVFVYGKERHEKVQLEKNPYKKLVESNDENLFSEIDSSLFYREKEKVEISDNEMRKRDLLFDDNLRKALVEHYQYAQFWILKKYGITDDKSHNHRMIGRVNANAAEELYWIKVFENNIESYFKQKKKRKKENYQCARIVNRLWNEWLSYVCMKYIDLGKAVYHFAMPNLYCMNGKEVHIGEVLPEYEEGLTSFDYEMIKAEESLTRNIATAVTIAANNFANAVIDDVYRQTTQKNKSGRPVDKSDVLTYSYEELRVNDNKEKSALKENAVRNLLQYFGGQSLWTELKGNEKLIVSVQTLLSKLRNSSFHYSSQEQTTENNKTSTEIAMSFFNKEYSRIEQLLGEKYFSNNVPAFYTNDKIYDLMNILYSKPAKRESQIPAFNVIIKRSYIETFMLESKGEYYRNKEGKFNNANNREIEDIRQNAAVKDIYFSSVYFVLKEIYYYGFLQQENLMSDFEKEFEKYHKDKIDKYNENDNNKTIRKEKEAADSFSKRLNEVKNANPSITLGQFCQQIMTDYNMQNQNQKKVLSNNEAKNQKKNGNKPIYQHYVLILRAVILETFRHYLISFTENISYDFLWKPTYDNEYLSNKFNREKDFLKDFISQKPEMLSIRLYEGVKKNITDEKMLSWYIASHFMSGRQINLLLGDFRSYKQYICKIDERAENTKSKHKILTYNISERQEYCDKVISILEFVQQFVGRISRDVHDYFGSEEEYAKYIMKFVNYDDYLNKISEEDGSDEKGKYALALSIFCSEKSENAGSTDKAIGLYYDAKNMILNRNVVYSKLYGDVSMLSECVHSEGASGEGIDYRVDISDINNYYNERKKVVKILKETEFSDKEQPKIVKDFQNLKNRIELLDIQIYTEMVNDIMAQMVSWAYMRERDLMYFQLGYHYVKLFWHDSEGIDIKPQYQKIEYSSSVGKREYSLNITEGALLYQIVALYTYSLPVFMADENGGISGIALSEGTAGSSIMPFVKQYCREDSNKADTYNGGLDFFGNEKRRDGFSVMRNDIAHMKYYNYHKKSIMEMYADMYNGFLQYDTKLKKSVSFISDNIMERYFMVLKTSMYHKDKEEEFRFEISKLESDQFTYKYREHKNDKWKTVEVDCRSEKFLEVAKRILEYKKM